MIPKGRYERGCTIALVVGVIMVVVPVAVLQLVSKARQTKFTTLVQTMAAEQRIIQQSYSALNQKLPFNTNAPPRLTKERLDKYLAIREPVLPLVKELSDQIEDMRRRKARGERGIALALKVMPLIQERHLALKRRHLVELTAAGISPLEYRWIGRCLFASLDNESATHHRDLFRDLYNSFRDSALRKDRAPVEHLSLFQRLKLSEIRPQKDEMAVAQEAYSRLLDSQGYLYLEVLYLIEGSNVTQEPDLKILSGIAPESPASIQ